MLKNLGNITFFTHNETDLILTNTQDLNTSSYAWKISLGLQMVNSFYSLTEDLSYWYLGTALFVLPLFCIYDNGIISRKKRQMQ